MSAAWKGRAVPFIGALALVCLVLVSSSGLGLVPDGDVAARTDAEAEQACPACGEPILERTCLPCGTVGFVSPERTMGEILRERARPTLPYYVDTEHFRIWYDTAGPDMIYGWPDTTFLHECKVVAERSWRVLVDTLGFRPPPPDGNDPDGGGGSDHYDVYLKHHNIMGGIGYAQPGTAVPGYPPHDRTSYVVIDNDLALAPWYPPVEMVRSVLGHEFGHATQFAHVCPLPMWFGEATSVWGSEMVYDYINEYLLDVFGDGPLIGFALARPYEALDLQEGPGWYSRVLWNLYLSETFGNAIIPEIWYDIEEDPYQAQEILSMTRVLAEYGVEFADAFEEYCIWNWFTGDRDDGNHYEEGGHPLWPEATPQATYSTFPVVSGSPPDTCRPAHLACNYIHFERGSAEDEVLRITYDGPAQFSVPNAAHIAYLDNALNSFYYGEVALNPLGNGTIDVEGFDEMSLVSLVVVNKFETPFGDDMNYTFGAELLPTGVPEVGGFELSAAVPSPFTLGTEIAYSVPGSATRADMSIYDVSGRLVTTLVDGVATPGAAVTYWDGTDADGRRVASGVYFARLVAGDETAVRKIVLLR